MGQCVINVASSRLWLTNDIPLYVQCGSSRDRPLPVTEEENFMPMLTHRETGISLDTGVVG